MKNLLLIALLVLSACSSTKKVSEQCKPIESINELELCEFPQATIVLSRGGQTVFPKAQAVAAPSSTPKPVGKK